MSEPPLFCVVGFVDPGESWVDYILQYGHLSHHFIYFLISIKQPLKTGTLQNDFVFNPTNHPMTTTGYPHLLIDGAIQFQHIQQQLQRAATIGEYQKYLQTKFLWTGNQYDSIQPVDGLPTSFPMISNQ